MQHNRNVKWLSEVKENGYEKQGEVNIDVERVKKQCGKIPNWKMPGLDGVQGYWFKYFTTCHERIAEQLSGLLHGEEIPDWLTCGNTILVQKNLDKGTAVDNFRPISCFPVCGSF